MDNKKIVKPFIDLKSGAVQETGFFFLKHILKARADLHFESGRHELDQEVNVYISGLLNSLAGATSFIRPKEYVSAFDADIRQYLEEHPGLRNEYIVYRDNADFGLLAHGVFLGYEHPGSYQHLVMPGGADQRDRIAQYYNLAASALSHLQGTHVALVAVFAALAEGMTEILPIMRRAAGYYFDLLERISGGSIYHLEREIDKMNSNKRYSEKLDDFLKAYSEYKAAPTEERKEALLALAGELSLMNEKFKFEEVSR
jgi:hypothetical protein